MTINKITLMVALKKCKSCVEKGIPLMEGSDCFIFHENKIISFNSSMAVAVKLDELVNGEIEGCVHAEEFFKTISKIGTNEIELTTTSSKNKIIVSSGNVKFEMPFFNFKNSKYFQYVIDMLETEADNWIDVPVDFMQGVNMINFDNKQSKFEGIYFNKNKMVVTDGHKMVRFTCDDVFPTFWLSSKSVDELLKLRNPEEMQLTESFVHFRKDNTVVSLRTANVVNYIPDRSIEKVITDVNNVCASGTFPIELVNAIDRASSFGVENTKQIIVNVILDNDKITVNAMSNNGKYNEVVEWGDCEHVPFDEPVNFNVTHDIMSFLEKENFEFTLAKDFSQDYVNKIIFKNNHCIFVCMLFKL